MQTVTKDGEIIEMTPVDKKPIAAPAERPNVALTDRGLDPRNFDELVRVSQMLFKSGMVPKGLDTPEKICTAIAFGRECGLTVRQSLTNIAVVNGRPTIFGDVALGLIQASGLLENFEEVIEGEGDAMRAVCTIKRRNMPSPISQSFSIADAKQAGLFGNNVWKQYPRRMLQMRARGFALRDGFADVLQGFEISERGDE